MFKLDTIVEMTVAQEDYDKARQATATCSLNSDRDLYCSNCLLSQAAIRQFGASQVYTNEDFLDMIVDGHRYLADIDVGIDQETGGSLIRWFDNNWKIYFPVTIELWIVAVDPDLPFSHIEKYWDSDTVDYEMRYYPAPQNN